MITAKVHFSKDKFRESLIAQLREQYRAILDEAGLSRVKFTVKIDDNGAMKFRADGSAKDIARAGKLLGIPPTPSRKPKSQGSRKKLR